MLNFQGDIKENYEVQVQFSFQYIESSATTVATSINSLQPKLISHLPYSYTFQSTYKVFPQVLKDLFTRFYTLLGKLPISFWWMKHTALPRTFLRNDPD